VLGLAIAPVQELRRNNYSDSLLQRDGSDVPVRHAFRYGVGVA
jgi:hypothetical protein